MEAKRTRTVVVSRDTVVAGNAIEFIVPPMGFIPTRCEILGGQVVLQDGKQNYLVTTSMQPTEVVCLITDGSSTSINSGFDLASSPEGVQTVYIWTAQTAAAYALNPSAGLTPVANMAGLAFNLIMRFT